MRLEPGVHVLARIELNSVLAELRDAETHVTRLPPGIASKSTFFDAARREFRLDPPLAHGHDNWDALEDSLFGLVEVVEPEIVIAWDDPSTLAAADPEASRIAVEILSALPSRLSNPDFNAGHTKRVVVILGGPEPR